MSLDHPLPEQDPSSRGTRTQLSRLPARLVQPVSTVHVLAMCSHSVGVGRGHGGFGVASSPLLCCGSPWVSGEAFCTK